MRSYTILFTPSTAYRRWAVFRRCMQRLYIHEKLMWCSGGNEEIFSFRGVLKSAKVLLINTNS